MFGLSYLKNEDDWSKSSHINERKGFALLFYLPCCSFALTIKELSGNRLCLATLPASFSTERTNQAFPRRRITFSRASVDYKTLQD